MKKITYYRNLDEGEIRNEYDEVFSLDEFRKLVESKRTAKLNHTIACRQDHPDYAARDCWLDEEGNSFSKAEFS